MTDLQKKIQKTSGWVVFAFYWMTLAPIGKLCQHGIAIAQNSRFPVAYHVAGMLLQLLGFAALMLAQQIFRDIRLQYTPFNPIHVQRLRLIAGLAFAVFLANSILEVWVGVGSGSFAFLTLFLLWLSMLDLAQLAIPVTVFCFS